MTNLQIHPQLIGATVTRGFRDGAWSNDINCLVIAVLVDGTDVYLFCKNNNGVVFKYNLQMVNLKFNN